MNEVHKESSVKTDVLEAIKKGKIEMKPKWRFVIEAVSMFVLLIVFFMSTVVISSFIFFIARRQGILYTPAFGFDGFVAAIKYLPWMAIMFFVFSTVILWFFLKTYSVVYHRPLIGSVFVILLLAIIGGYTLDRVHFHNYVMSHASGPGGYTFVQKFYSDKPRPKDLVIRGEVVQVIDPDFIVQSHLSEPVRVRITKTTRLPFGYDIQPGDFVVVFIRPNMDSFEAKGIIEVTGERMFMCEAFQCH